jgi:hypothetical protein
VAVPFYIGTAGVYRPGRITNLAADQGFIDRFAETDRNLGFAFGQIKMTVADHELDAQTRITCMKGVDEWCPPEAICHARSAGQANSARETFVARGEATFEGRHRCLHTLGSGPQFLAELGQSITAEMAFYQPAADMPLKLCDATLNGRLIDAQRLRCCLHAACARKRQEVPEVIPSKVHSCSMQLCEPSLQSCDWRGACPNVIVSRRRSGGSGAAALAKHPLAH